jgi:hypothetical protein
MDTKKILMYGGGAIVLGAVTYFVWAFFQKPVIPIGNTTIALGGTEDEEEETKTNTKPPTKKGSGKVYDFSPREFDPIFTPNIYDINSFALNKQN